MSGLPEKRCVNEVSLLPYDLIFKILLLLPAKDLLKLTLVCKTWHKIINSPNFIETHITKCEPVLTFLKHFPILRRNAFSIDTKNQQFILFDPQSSSKNWELQIFFMEFEDRNTKITNPNICDFKNILATCDGLVLATTKRGSLVILNPTTRKILQLKPGTIVPTRDESYGFVFSHFKREYTVVHVFKDKSGHTDSEILSLTTGLWRGIDVPSFGLFQDFNHKPVSASGILYWLPGNHNINYFVSMDTNDPKFIRKALPVNETGMNDRLVENGGLLNFITQITVYRIELWSFKRNPCEEMWIKRYTIHMDYDITGLVPVLMTKKGRCLIFEQLGLGFYEYDMEEEEMEKVLVNGDVKISNKMVFNHVNTLASWSNSGSLW